MHPAIISDRHYHIRWLPSGRLDWQPFPTRTEAENVAQEIVLERESFTAEAFDDTCTQRMCRGTEKIDLS